MPSAHSDHPLAAAVSCSMDALSLSAADEGAAALAARLAAAIDADPDNLKDLGPQLLRVLEALGATPVSRSKLPATPPLEQDQDELTLRRLRGAA